MQRRRNRRWADEYRQRPFDAFYATPRQRVIDTADIIEAHLPLTATIIDDLRGPDHGQADGRSWYDVKSDFGGPPQHAPDRPYAPGSETWNQYLDQAHTVLRDILSRHAGQKLLVVAHGETVEAVHTLLLKLPPSVRLRVGVVTDHASVTRWQEHVNRFDRHVWMLAAHNDTSSSDPTVTEINAQALVDICRQHLGSAAQLVAPQVGGNGTLVVRVATAGGDVVVKRHRSQERHAQEVHAYGNWTAALGDQSPRLLGVDHDARAIIVSAAPGAPMAETSLSPAEERAAFARMGEALQRFHAAGPARDDTNMVAWLAERGSRWLDAARHVVSPSDRITIKAHLRALEGLSRLPTVPCHLDFTPRNVLVGPTGITVIDFEHARYDLAARDLVRLSTRTWPRRQGSRPAFLRGYGPLTDVDELVVEHCTYLDRLTATARAARIELPSEPDQQVAHGGHGGAPAA